jgi:hypothetical protein
MRSKAARWRRRSLAGGAWRRASGRSMRQARASLQQGWRRRHAGPYSLLILRILVSTYKTRGKRLKGPRPHASFPATGRYQSLHALSRDDVISVNLRTSDRTGEPLPIAECSGRAPPRPEPASPGMRCAGIVRALPLRTVRDQLWAADRCRGPCPPRAPPCCCAIALGLQPSLLACSSFACPPVASNLVISHSKRSLPELPLPLAASSRQPGGPRPRPPSRVGAARRFGCRRLSAAAVAAAVAAAPRLSPQARRVPCLASS